MSRAHGARTGASRQRRGAPSGTRTRSILREYVEAILWAVAMFLVLRTFLIQAFRIPSGSMLDTLLIGDFLFVNKVEYGARIPFTHVRLPGLREPRRGDVIVFRYPGDPRQDWVKRCVAVGGETIEGRNKAILVDGRTLTEPYVVHADRDTLPASLDVRDNFGPVRVPAGHYFMMGDNRDNSRDSRYWGPLPKDMIEGRAMFIYWSWDADRFRPRLGRLLRIIH
jgi:signal peptidase I